MITNKKNPFMYQAGKVFLAVGVSLMFSVAASAQTTPPDQLGEVDENVPFDGGVSLMVAAGVAYGAKQWKQIHKEDKDSAVTPE